MKYARSFMSVTSAAEATWVPESIRTRAQSLIAKAVLTESRLWTRQAYGYFRGMYVPESGSRDVSGLIHDPSHSIDPDRHAAVALIRTYFPDHQPREDLITNSEGIKLYGSYPCSHCGERVQYDARYDALVMFGVANGLTCGKAERHEW